MGKYILVKLGVAISASFVLSLLIAFQTYDPLSELESFTSSILVYLIYALPVIVVSGIPISILIDKLVSLKGPVLNFLIKTILYALAGAVVFIIILFLLNMGAAWDFKYLYVNRILFIGTAGAVLFYWVECIFKIIAAMIKKLR